MKFLDLNTGYSIDALWTNNQTNGYIFWFPNEQSIGITYTKPIAFVSDTNTPIELHIEDNDVFSFISNSNISETVDGYVFDGYPVYTKSTSTNVEVVNDKYIHTFNVAACAKDAGEYICKLKIGDFGFIRIGIDAYGEDESLYVNLSNMGVEIPTGVQKAIYNNNVHEDKTDNILINRKFKELLTNYWDIIANKGSYKSLLNSIEWFEWDDSLKIKEIIKRQEANRYLFSDKDVISQLKNDIDDTIGNFIKTTYISLYCSLQDELPSYDNEFNPELAQVALKWSRDDIQLKIALLAQFFGIYFLPIHISILHATAEDKIFTNTIKAIHGSEIKRDDLFGDFNYIESNVKDNNVYKLTNVSAQVSNSTIFGVDSETAYFGVDCFPKNDIVDTHLFSKQYYSGPGVIIPIELVIPNQMRHDFVKQTIVEFENELGPNKFVFNTIFNAYKGNIRINFNLLAKNAFNYNLKFTFILGSSKTLSRTVKFVVEDADNLNINIYKVHAKDDSNGLTMNDFVDTSCSKYIFGIQNKTLNTTNRIYIQYLPYMLPDNENYIKYNGIKLTRTLVYDVKNDIDYNTEIWEEKLSELHARLTSNTNGEYLEFAKYDANDNSLCYLIYVSKYFNVTDPLGSNGIITSIIEQNAATQQYNKYNIIRNDLGFYPQFHYLEKMDGNNIDDYTISIYDAICCAPEINNGNNVIDFRYGREINDAEWEFYNNSTNASVKYNVNNSSSKPFVANFEQNALKPGYYDIIFKYSLTNGVTGECKLDSAFRIK
jgi:hypothetical protein